jgi:hypothetical protein
MGGIVVRGLLVLALLVMAGVHLERWFSGYRDIVSVIGGQEYLIVGPLFLVNVAAGVVLAIAVPGCQALLYGDERIAPQRIDGGDGRRDPAPVGRAARR